MSTKYNKVNRIIMTGKNQSSNRVDIREGDRFGRLVVLSEEPVQYYGEGEKRRGRRTFRCLCDCGKETVVRFDRLRAAKKPTKSCGCLGAEVTVERCTKHDMARTLEYKTWLNMRKRCYVPTHAHYEYYGGRGIQVCPEWRDSFEAFIADMGLRPSDNHSLDRIDSNGDYCPSTVRRATTLEQGSNRRNNRMIEYQGESKHLKEWSRFFGFNTRGFYLLVNKKGLSDSEAIGVLADRANQ